MLLCTETSMYYVKQRDRSFNSKTAKYRDALTIMHSFAPSILPSLNPQKHASPSKRIQALIPQNIPSNIYTIMYNHLSINMPALSSQSPPRSIDLRDSCALLHRSSSCRLRHHYAHFAPSSHREAAGWGVSINRPRVLQLRAS